MKRIGIDCRLWNETGVGRYIRNLVKELAKIDTSSEYVLFFRKQEYETVAPPGKNFSKRLADVRWHTLEEQLKLPAILNKETLDLVHFPYFSYPVFYKKPFVITIHDLIIDHFPTGKASTLPAPILWVKQLGYRFVLSQAIAKSQKVLTVSQATRQEIEDHYHPSSRKVVVTSEGFDTSISREHMEAVAIKQPYFLYVGNAYPHKNLERLIEGFDLFLKKNDRKAYLILVGKEDYFYKHLRESVSRKGLEDRIFFYENVSDAELSYLYHHALSLVLPSLMEGFGLPALEAMANNCLVLASEIPAFLEVCGQTAEYFDPFDTKAIAKGLQKAYDHTIEHVRVKKEEGYKRAQMFSWKKMAQETINTYESCISLRQSK